MPNLKPYRYFAPTDVLNHFSYRSGPTLPKGTFVKILSGIVPTDEPENMAGPVASSYTDTVSERWVTWPCIVPAVSGDTALGMTLWDVKETDENGELLKFKPRKLAELQAVLSGQAVPIVLNGVFLYSGISGTPAAGGSAYLGPVNGELADAGATASIVGKFLGPKDANGWAFVRVNL